MPSRPCAPSPVAVLCAALLCLCLAACGGGKGLDAPASVDGFRLELLPGGESLGGDAGSLSLVQSESAEGVELEVRATSARGLKALYFAVSYDPARFSPTQTVVSEAFAPREQRLDLTIASEPGRVEHGSVLIRPQDDAHPGFSGDGVLATLRFARRPFSAERRISTPPLDDNSRARCGLDNGNLVWYYYNSGDYDQNGVVAVQDLTPIGINFGKDVPETSPGAPYFKAALDVIDGSRDQKINVQDLTSIGVSFGYRVASYNIYAAADSSAYPATNLGLSTIEPLMNVPLSTALGDKASDRLRFSALVEAAAPDSVFWVRPVDAFGNEGTPSQTTETSGLLGSIAGTVFEDTDNDHIGDAPLAGVSISLEPGAISTASFDSGEFLLEDLAFGSVTITPSLEGYHFIPASVELTLTAEPEELDFVASLDANNTPPQVDSLFRTPSATRPGTIVQLEAEASDSDGDTLLYTWTVESGSGSLQHTETAAGLTLNAYLAPPELEETVQIKVSVNDQRGGEANVTTDISVDAEASFNWHEFVVHGGADANTGLRSSLIELGGRPVIYYYNQSAATGDGVYWASPADFIGESWVQHGKVGDGGFGGLAAFTLGDVTAAAAYDDTAGLNQLKFYYRSAADSEVHQSFTVDSATGCGGNVCGLVTPGGQPLLAYHNDLSLATGALRFAAASDFSSDTWSAPLAVEGEPELPAVDLGSESSIALIGGFPAVAYYDKTLGTLRYARASDANGSSWDAPAPLVVEATALVDTGHWPQLLEVSGRPAVFYVDFTNSRLYYERAEDSTGSAWGQTPAVVDLNGCRTSSSISATMLSNGHPYVVYGHIATTGIWGTEMTQPDGPDLSGDSIVFPEAGFYNNPSVAEIGGRLAVSCFATDGQDLIFSLEY